MRFFLVFFLVLGLSLPAGHAMAARKKKNVQPEATLTTVVKVRASYDNAKCILTGNLVSKLLAKGDEYLFRDSSAEVIVRIRHDVMPGHRISPSALVQIHGSVNKKFGKPTIVEVSRLEILE